MRKSLSWKLTLAFILVAFITAALVAVFIRITSAGSLNQLIIDQRRNSLQQLLADYYVANNSSWNGVGTDWSQLQPQSVPGSNGPSQGHFTQGGRSPNSRDPRTLFGLADEQGRVIVSIDPEGLADGARAVAK